MYDVYNFVPVIAWEVISVYIRIHIKVSGLLVLYKTKQWILLSSFAE